MQTEDNKKLFLLSKVYVSLIQLTRLYLVKYYRLHSRHGVLQISLQRYEC